MQTKEVVIILFIISAVVFSYFQTPGHFSSTFRTENDLSQEQIAYRAARSSPFHAPQRITGAQAFDGSDESISCTSLAAPGCGEASDCPPGTRCASAGDPGVYTPVDQLEPSGCSCLPTSPPPPPPDPSLCENSAPACTGTCDDPNQVCNGCVCINKPFAPCRQNNCVGYCFRGQACVGCQCVDVLPPPPRGGPVESDSEAHGSYDPIEMHCNPQAALVVTAKRDPAIGYLENSPLDSSPLGIHSHISPYYENAPPHGDDGPTIEVKADWGFEVYFLMREGDDVDLRKCRIYGEIQQTGHVSRYPCVPGTSGCSNPNLDSTWWHRNEDLVFPQTTPPEGWTAWLDSFNARAYTPNGRCAYDNNGRAGPDRCKDGFNNFEQPPHVSNLIKGNDLVTYSQPSYPRYRTDMERILTRLAGANYANNYFIIMHDDPRNIVLDIRRAPIGRYTSPRQPQTSEPPNKQAMRGWITIEGDLGTRITCSYGVFSGLVKLRQGIGPNDFIVEGDQWDVHCA